MTALEFLQVCAGCGIIVVCLAYATKMLSDVRFRTRGNRDVAQRKEEPLDPLGQQLHEFRNARFGRPMVEPTKDQTQTWPVLPPKVVPPPVNKNVATGKRQGGK